MTANPRQAPSYAHWTLLYVQWTHRHVPMLRACHAAFCTTPHIRESRQAEYAAHGWHRKRTVSSSRWFPPARGSFPQYASAWCSATWTAIRLPYFPANREHVGSNPLPQSSQRSSRYVSAAASVLCTTMVPRMAPINTTAMPTMAQNRVNVLDVSIWSLSDNPMNTTPLSLTCPVLVFSLQGSATTRHGDCAACMMA